MRVEVFHICSAAHYIGNYYAKQLKWFLSSIIQCVSYAWKLHEVISKNWILYSVFETTIRCWKQQRLVLKKKKKKEQHFFLSWR